MPEPLSLAHRLRPAARASSARKKPRRSSGHGADPLTSIGLHLFPELMRPDLMPAAKPLKRDPALDCPSPGLGTASFEGAEVGMPHEYDEVIPPASARATRG